MFLLSRIRLLTVGFAVFLRQYFTLQNDLPRAAAPYRYVGDKLAFARVHLSTDSIGVAPLVRASHGVSDCFRYFDFS